MVETKLIAPPTLLIAEDNLKSPVDDEPRFSVDPCQLIVPIKPVALNELQATVPVTEATPLPLFASKKQSSAEVGTDAPEAPPDVADHTEVVEPSQVAVPPTQYLEAANALPGVTNNANPTTKSAIANNIGRDGADDFLM